MTAALKRVPAKPATKPAVKRVELEDQGQDFTEWDLDEDGVVVACRPSQNWVWCGVRVVNDRTLRRGSRLQLTLSDGRDMVLHYKAAMVTRLTPERRVA